MSATTDYIRDLALRPCAANLQLNLLQRLKYQLSLEIPIRRRIGFAHYARATFFRPNNAGAIQADTQPVVLGPVCNMIQSDRCRSSANLRSSANPMCTILLRYCQ